MDRLFLRQSELINEIERIDTNFDKDGPSRKTPDYIERRLIALDNLWGEFEHNNTALEGYEDKSSEYFNKDIYAKWKEAYQSLRNKIAAYPMDTASTSKGSGDSDDKPLSFSVPKTNKDQGTIPCGPTEELLSQQGTYFRAFSRILKGIDIESMEEKWEIEDHLKDLQYRWRTIEELHLRIDNILQGTNECYEKQFIGYERLYNNIKKLLNKKLCSTAHLRESTPKVEIPVFTGKYAQWPTFFDLFADTIHKNNFLSKAQKMQHLKGKVKGEAERLIQHLNISSENYDTAWDLLTHRYNNPHALFTYQIETFLSQPNVHKQTSHELKRLYDTTMECIHAIHNLGVDTTTWDPLLVHLISKKLDAETYSDYKEARKSPRELAKLDELMDFIEGKFTALEPINKKDTLDQKPTFHQPRFGNKPSFYNKPRSNHYQAVATFTLKCPLCHGEHDLYKCKRFLNLPADAKMRALAKHEICQNCLYKHFDKPCNSTKRCKSCNEEHNSIIHDAIIQLSCANSTLASQKNANATRPPSNKQHNVNHVATDDEEVLLTTVSLKIRAADNTFVILRALLDQGSQISLISENAAQMLGLQRRSYHASVSGIGSNSKQSKGMVNLQCQSIYGDHDFTTQALVISRVISHLPNTTFGKQSWPHLQHINLADPEYNVSRPIDLLLDASIYSDIIMSGLIKGPSGAPIAQQTTLGWILSGNVKTFNCHVVINQVDEISKFWEVEDINDNISSTMSTQDKYCEEFYQSTTRHLDNGRYEVALPMLTDFEQNLGASKPKAVMQFKHVEKRMQNNPALYEAYRKFINEYQELRHMRPADAITTNPTCYLPHHGVQKLDSTTTALRVVFNASAKTTSGHSLNDLMACGPNLQQDLQGLILKWRMHKYVITADIEKMYRQILIRECDQHLQTIIWRDSPQHLLKEYQLTTVTYGTKAAPFLAIRTLKQIAKDNVARYPLAASALDNSFYMDDLMSGHDDLSHTKILQNQLIEVLKGAGMNLRKWSSNEPKLIEHLSANQLNAPLEFKDTESRKTLGLRWNPSTDTFTFQNKIDYQENRGSHTKRQLLSDISKIYDPLGWLSPITIKAKILFQKTWLLEITWDDELPADILQEWRHLREDLKNIEDFVIPRYLGSKQHYQLHGFCDASEKAYACAVYLTTKCNKGEYTSHLVAAKTKVAPHNKQISLPRLELLGALLLSQLMKKVVESIPAEDININAWTDSMVVLGWLKGDTSRWKQFVANRVRQITDVIPASNWRHVKSEDNAADCATRGLTTPNLQKHSLWWVGPQWLTTFDPQKEIPIQLETPNIEIKKASVNTALCQNDNSIITQLLKSNSSITRVGRIIGWVSRFITRLRNKQGVALQSASTLTSSELQAAHILIIKSTQAIEFEDDIRQIKKKGHVRSSSKILSLNPFLDEDEVLRVGGRLSNAKISYSAKHPVILSTHSRLTELIIKQAHITTLHGGPRLTLSFIRDKFWIISGIRTVKKQLRLCVKCRRYSQENKQQIMADLPAPRVTPSRPFTNTGVDFTGHVEIKANKGRGIKTTKAYVAVFVCLATKAVHLELVSDLSTAAFLAAFYRFCARRGNPKHMYSDNGTNFVGASRVLKKEHKVILETIDDSFIRNINEMGITWHFNAPSWPSAGGLWEAAVKSLKYHLKRVLGEQRLTYEEFITLLYQIEACMNSRPLCPLTESADDECLTPGHFLVGDTLLSRPQTDPDSITLPTRWQLVQALNKQLWKKWSNEYLQHLQSRSKWRTASKNLDVNDIVIIKEDNMPPGKWAIGRVLELHPGKDGHVRVVTLKTQSNVIKRPVNKLINLPTNETSTTSDSKGNQAAPGKQQPVISTRPSRRRGNALSHFAFMALIMFMALISPSTQQSTTSYNITHFNDHQSLYFDKISDLQQIRDEWKLVIFYNLTTYWHGLSDIRQYVTHLKSLCHKSGAQFESVALQLQHSVDEIEHYNDLLKYQNKRSKRGLVNGVGYIANSLFGVLDERFADQYKKDIDRVMKNENHLHNLIKNQTLVIEAEYNILRRHEDTMKQQFSIIQQHLQNITVEVGQVRRDYNNGIYLTSSALAASIILSNLRFMQQTLITTVTDINHGRIDTHLFPPEQLEKQTNFILSQLHGDLVLPTDKHDIRQMYKLLRVYSRIMEDYLITEIRIPLVSSDIYELDRVLSIPQRREDNMTYRLVPTLPFIAFNLKRDMAFLLSHDDLQGCIHTQMDKILCSLDQPIYDVKLKQSICDIELVNINTMNSSPCTSQTAPCTVGQWIKLHRRNDWLYSCCQECKVRIFCTAGMEIRTLIGNGYINLGQGCSLKGDTFTINSHKHFLSNIHQQAAAIDIPETSVLNSLINSSVPSEVLLPTSDDNDVMLDQLKTQIEELKNNSFHEFNSHDIHHYSLQYIMLIGILVLAGVGIQFWRRRKSHTPKQQPETARSPQSAALHLDDIRRVDSVTSVDQATSPRWYRWYSTTVCGTYSVVKCGIFKWNIKVYSIL